MKYRLEFRKSIDGTWVSSTDFAGEYTLKQAQAIIEIKIRDYMQYRAVPIKKKTRLASAKDYQKQIANLQREREKLYAKALRELKMKDTSLSFDWFFNDQQGKGEFVGIIGK